VVPSRWENFPYTCIEAMGSGLPVIASRDGGMAEMIEDGRTGWLASKTGSDGLAEALRRALGTEPKRMAEMGRNASEAIAQICNGKKILEHELDFRSQVVRQGATQSLRLPANLPGLNQALARNPALRTPQIRSHEGIAVVITGARAGYGLNGCLQSVEGQTRPPVMSVVVADASPQTIKLETLNGNRQDKVQFIYDGNGESGSAKNAGIEAVFKSGANPLAFCFLNPGDRLHPRFVAECETILGSCPEVGLVSCWVGDSSDRDKLWIKPCPSFPYQYLANDAVSFSAVRTEALREAGNFRSELSRGYEEWDLVNAVIAAGWRAVTIPDVLGYQRFRAAMAHHKINDDQVDRKMRREVLERFPDLIISNASELILLTESHTIERLRRDVFNFGRQIAIMRMALYHPQWAALHIIGKIKGKIRRHTLTKLKPSKVPESVWQEAE